MISDLVYGPSVVPNVRWPTFKNNVFILKCHAPGRMLWSVTADGVLTLGDGVMPRDFAELIMAEWANIWAKAHTGPPAEIVAEPHYGQPAEIQLQGVQVQQSGAVDADKGGE